MKKLKFPAIIIGVCLILSAILSFVILKLKGNLIFPSFIKTLCFTYITNMLFFNAIFSHRFVEGKKQEILSFISTVFLISILLAYLTTSIINSKFDFDHIDWFGNFIKVIDLDYNFLGLVFIFIVGFLILYFTFIDRKMINYFGKPGLRGDGKLKSVQTNLENSRWMTPEERNKIFKPHKYSNLVNVKKDGIPVMAKLTKKDKDIDVVYNSPCHSLIIGSTGSGKTTTFVNPMIQLIGATGAGSSMIMTDPKGELFSMHSKFLVSRGYDVKVIDLRDTYSSYRWNPLDDIYDAYQKYLKAHTSAFARTDDPFESGLKLIGDDEEYENITKWYEFENVGYADYQKLVQAIKIYKKKVYDEIYEDLNDLVSVLIPVENEKDPMWEKGARSITLAVLLAMLEDSGDPRLEMTKEKFNFFNMTKILQNSSKDYLELRNYFAGRSVLSKAYSLSKQVCDAAEQTRASYMSIVYEKLTMFNDAGICALTSASDFVTAQLAEKPTALFLKIPDEKDTRHNLAAIFILNIYKTLIKVASMNEDLSLPRNVYFILDEFGNMPKIEKFDKMITVGRSRKIWFNMIIQSYAQLNNVYGDTVADIVKGNCGIKMFIGSNDMNTCKEYSELCGNITVVTTSTSGSINGKDTNISSQTQVRPLIYPSELQRLNHPGDIGNSIIVTFGNYPLKTYFSPSFKVPFYVMGKMDTSDLEDRFFDENSILFNISKRNELIFKKDETPASGGRSIGKIEPKKVVVEQSSDGKQEILEEQTNDLKELERLYLEYIKENEGASYISFIKHMNSVLVKEGL